MKNYLKPVVFLLWSMLLGLGATAQCPNAYTIETYTHPDCSNANNGSIGATGTTYYGNSTFLWSNGSTGRYLYNVSIGHYSVTITDPTGCTYNASTYVGPNPTGSNIDLHWAACENELTVNPYAQDRNLYQYQWSTGATTSNIQVTTPGLYSVTVTSPVGCVGQASYTVASIFSPVTTTASTTPAGCNASTGSITLSTTGGLAPYSYRWHRIQPNGRLTYLGQGSSMSNLPAGAYEIRTIDANRCSETSVFVVGGPRISFDALNVSCGQGNNGSITANVFGMNNPTYSWSNGATTASISNLTTGSYDVTVTEGACTLSESITIRNGGQISVYIVDSNSHCSLLPLTAYAYGGSGGGYTYLWNTGETTQSITPQAGQSMYIVTVTDAGGCTNSDTLIMGVNGVNISVSAAVQDATCGNSDGAIDLTVSGSYSRLEWEPSIYSGEDLTNIPAGRYIANFYSGSSCLIHRDTFDVGEFIETTYSGASCGLSNGSASVTTYNMTNPSYLWSNGATTASLSNLAAGQYIVSVTNGSCLIVDTIDVINAGQLSASITPSSSCAPDFLLAIPTDGVAPYSFIWNDGSTTQNLNSPVVGNSYQVTITDRNGCTASASYIVPNYPMPSATSATTPASCDNKNGSIVLTPSGGTPPYQYSWSLGNGNSPSYIGVYAGQYSATITDNNGCRAVLSNIQVAGQATGTVRGVVTQPSNGQNNGQIDVTANGMTNPTFLWNTGATTEDLTNIGAGRYTVSVTDAATGCITVRRFYLSGAGVSSGRAMISGYVYDVTSTNSCQRGLPQAFKMVRLQPSGVTTFTDSRGFYAFSVPTSGTYTVEYVNASAGTTVLCPTGSLHTINVVAGQAYSNNNFHLTNPPFDDLRIRLRDYSNATPGFPYVTRVRFCNDGNTNRSGTIEYDYNSLLDFDRIVGFGSALTLHDIPNHRFYWSFTGLRPAECRYIDVTFTVPTTTALGTVLTGTVNIDPVVGDVNPANNTESETIIVNGSYDPNDKQVNVYRSGDPWNGGRIYTTDEVLDYTIRFQNTGTAPANWVIIRDTLDGNLLPETIRDIDSKHDVEVSLEQGNILVFTFNNIYLPDSSVDMQASMGFVQFTINRQAGLPAGTEIPNRAAIYFDYNPPIITNQPVSIIDRNISVVELEDNAWDVMLQPNPFNEKVLVSYDLDQATTVRISLYNQLGQCVHRMIPVEQAAGHQQVLLNAPDLPQGYYLLQVETDQERLTKPLIKQ